MQRDWAVQRTVSQAATPAQSTLQSDEAMHCTRHEPASMQLKLHSDDASHERSHAVVRSHCTAQLLDEVQVALHAFAPLQSELQRPVEQLASHTPMPDEHTVGNTHSPAKQLPPSQLVKIGA